MIARVWRGLAVRLPDRAATALAAYESDPGSRPALGALYGYRQITNRRRQLVDGPACLAVLTAETIALTDAKTGAVIIERPLTELTGYLIDDAGRFVVRFDDRRGHSHVGSFRPLSAPGVSACAHQASAKFVHEAIMAWEARTGRPFTNSWATPGGR